MKGKKYLGIGAVLGGAVFLCNPIVSVIDILPDFIGYLLILRGIYALADINVYLEDARKYARYLALSSLGRVLSLLFIFGIASAHEQSTMLVLASFAFGVIDCFLIIRAWTNVFGGITYLATGHGGVEALRQVKGGSATDVMQKNTLISLIFLQVMAFLPELASFTDRSVYTDLDTPVADFSSFIGLFRGTAVIASLAVGIPWLIKMFKYVKRLKSDKPFFESLEEKYQGEVLARPQIFTVREIYRALLCFAAALVLSVDFYDLGELGCNVIPDVLCALLMVAGILLIRRHVVQWIIPTAVCSLYGAYEIAAWAVQCGFFKDASASDIFKSNSVYDAYYGMCAFTVGGEVLFFIALVFVMFTLYCAVEKHTGVSALSQSGLSHAEERTKHIHNALGIRLIIIGSLGWLSAVSTIVYFMILPSAYGTLWEAYWILNMLIGGIFAGTFVSFIFEMRERMEYKYGLF